VAIDPSTPPNRSFGSVQTGPGIVFIFTFAHLSEESASEKPLASAPDFCVKHLGVSADCMQWCPSHVAFPPPADESNAASRRGLLLAVLGSGEVVIWAVPKRMPNGVPPECEKFHCSLIPEHALKHCINETAFSY
jgi:hypothetical protein